MKTHDALRAEANSKIEAFNESFRDRLRTEAGLFLDTPVDGVMPVVAKRGSRAAITVEPSTVWSCSYPTGKIKVKLQAFTTGRTRTFSERKDGSINLDGVLVALRDMLQEVQQNRERMAAVSKARSEKIKLEERLKKLDPSGRVAVDAVGSLVELRIRWLEAKTAEAVIQAYLTIIGGES